MMTSVAAIVSVNELTGNDSGETIIGEPGNLDGKLCRFKTHLPLLWMRHPDALSASKKWFDWPD